MVQRHASPLGFLLLPSRLGYLAINHGLHGYVERFTANLVRRIIPSPDPNHSQRQRFPPGLRLHVH